MERDTSFKLLPAIKCLLISLSLICMTQWGFAQEFNIFLSPAEGGKLKTRNIEAFINYLSKSQCHIRFTDKKNDADLLLGLESTVSDGFEPYLKIKTYSGLPLNLSVLVKSSRSVDRLEQLKGEPLSIINAYSEMGFLSQYVELAVLGLSLEESEIFESGRYEGALALLLHGDVFAAILPNPLAEKWKKENNLNIIANSSANEFPYLWIKSDDKLIKEADGSNSKACSAALVKLGTRNRRDKRFSIFPLWVEGFNYL